MAPWDLLQTFSEPTDNVQGVTFVTVGGTEQIVLHENTSGGGYVYEYDDANSQWAQVNSYTLNETVWGIDGSPTDSLVAYATHSDVLEILDASDWSSYGTFGSSVYGHNMFSAPSFSPDGSMLAGVDDAGNIGVFNVSDGSVIHSDSYVQYTQVPEWSPDGQYLSFAVRDEGVYILNTSDWSQHGFLDVTASEIADDRARGTGWSEDSSMVGFGTSGADMYLYDADTLDHQYTLTDPATERGREVHFFDDDQIAVHANQDGGYVHEFDSGTDSWTHTTTMSDGTTIREDWSISADRGLFLTGSASAEGYLYEAIPKSATVPLSGQVSGSGLADATLTDIRQVLASGQLSAAGSATATPTASLGSGGSVSASGTSEVDPLRARSSAGAVAGSGESTATPLRQAGVIGTLSGAGVTDATSTVAGPVPVSGTAQLDDGTLLEGATIRGINDTTDTEEAVVTTDANGDYTIEFPAGDEAHFLFEYDVNGTRYQAESQPFIVPE